MVKSSRVEGELNLARSTVNSCSMKRFQRLTREEKCSIKAGYLPAAHTVSAAVEVSLQSTIYLQDANFQSLAANLKVHSSRFSGRESILFLKTDVVLLKCCISEYMLACALLLSCCCFICPRLNSFYLVFDSFHQPGGS